MDLSIQGDQNRKFVFVMLVAVIPFAAAATLLLTSIFGPSDVGVRCTRERGSVGQCEVLQSRLLGFAGNSSFPIPESEIAGARAVCAHQGVGGRSGPSCSVRLLLKSGTYRDYPVLSYPLADPAESSARRLNDYFADPTRSSIELRDQVGTNVLIVVAPALLAIAVVLVLRLWRRRSR